MIYRKIQFSRINVTSNKEIEKCSFPEKRYYSSKSNYERNYTQHGNLQINTSRTSKLHQMGQ